MAEEKKKKQGQQQEARNKDCKKSRRPKAKIAAYWNFTHPRNMLSRALRVYKRHRAFAERSETNFNRLMEVARSEARKCASAHGPMVEAGLQRELSKF